MANATVNTAKTTANTAKTTAHPDKPVAKKASSTASSATAKGKIESKVTDLPVESRMAPLEKKKKSDKKKVIRDSFSFPEQDYHKISELKRICLAAGVHVKKGEILRAGLNLLTNLKMSELLNAVEAVERVQTGRPKAEKE